ncbi:hypothetical protein HK102_013913 [Quaeritorhiza haematococci]|nr:hypothetical protein HK102_013913 [Quaeritorhiza haematococci]
MRVLILDDAGTPSINKKKSSYSNYISDGDGIDLSIITSLTAVSDEDKNRCAKWIEINNPTVNGLLEVNALEFEKEFNSSSRSKDGIDVIYTKQEDLIIRAAYLRKFLASRRLNWKTTDGDEPHQKHDSGLTPEQALVYRDKALMKTVAEKGGFPVPPFQRVQSPSDVLQFVENHGFPVVLKPTFGSASTGIKVLHNMDECKSHLERDFFATVDNATGQFEHRGDVVIEKFVKNATMYHVNGFWQDGALVRVWPFQYISTNLEFTSGKSYGNVSIPKTDPRWERLIQETERLLRILPTPDRLVFHLELFEVADDSCDGTTYLLCEIAARRPGGSIGLLLDMMEGGPTRFEEMQFRFSIGLPFERPKDAQTTDKEESPDVVGDLLVPLQLGRLIGLPPESEGCPISIQGRALKYIPLGKPGTVYKGFSVNTLNTCARFVAQGSTATEVEAGLQQACEWFRTNVRYEQEAATAPPQTNVPVSKETHVIIKPIGAPALRFEQQQAYGMRSRGGAQ